MNKKLEKRAIALYQSGLTLKAAGSRVGYTEAQVSRIMRRYGVPTRTRAAKASLRGRRKAMSIGGQFIFHQCAKCEQRGIPAYSPVEAWLILMERGWKIKADLNVYCPKHA